MPHKRAKRSVREKRKEEQCVLKSLNNKGSLRVCPRKSDLPPVQGFNDDMPKSVARILNAESIQRAWREKKRGLGDGGEDRNEGGKKRRKLDNSNDARKKDKGLKIKPGESLGHFNRYELSF